MASLNKILLIGNLGRDPEIKNMSSGDAVCNFSIACTETWKDKRAAPGENRMGEYRHVQAISRNRRRISEKG